jgi:anti-sigma B factor antagonist
LSGDPDEASTDLVPDGAECGIRSVAMLHVPPVFSLRRQQLPLDSYVVAVTGEIDIHTAPQLENELLTLIREGAAHVVVDLSDASFLDSYGLSVLLAAARCLGRERFAVAGAGIESRRVIEITGADRVLVLVDAPAKATT